ncbi:MAG: TolC family protein, partial [Gillisia sp.]
QSTYLRQKELLTNTKKQLNEILAREIDTDFKVVDEIQVDKKLILPELQSLAAQQNPDLQARILNKKINELQLKEVKANRFPTIVANTGYNFGQSQSSLGFTTNSSSHGFNYGFSATLNLFDGFNQNRNEKIAKIRIENADLLISQQNETLVFQLETAYQTYLTNLKLIELEKSNEIIARENLDITLEKYKIGTIPTIEFRTAQLNYTNAKVRYSNALFEAKQSEITLKELSGKLEL